MICEEMPDPVKQLEDTISWHVKQVELIKEAIVLLKGGENKIQEKQNELKQEPFKQESLKIKWARKIDKVFEDHNNLTLDEVIQKLIIHGIDELTALKNRSIVYCTLARKYKGKKKTLTKSKSGIYSRIKSISTPIPESNKKEESD